MRTDYTLEWRVFGSMRDARRALGTRPCIYVQADLARTPVRVGKAAHGLAATFRGALAEAFDAAMHGSSNRLHVAPVRGPACAAVARELLWRLRGLDLYNAAVPSRRPATQAHLQHRGAKPRFPPGARG